MGDFTSLATGGSAQSLAMANELVLAYSERRQALGQSAVSALAAGDSAQDGTLWLAMQHWLEDNHMYFLDTHDIPNKSYLNGTETGFQYFNLATWQAAADLNVSAVPGESFRRYPAPAGTAMTYGYLQRYAKAVPRTGTPEKLGDARGSWNFEDLQKGFGALKWTKAVWASGNPAEGHWSSNGENTLRSYTTPDLIFSWAACQADAEAGWDAASNGDGGTARASVYSTSWMGGYLGNWYKATLYRNSSYPRVLLSAAFRPRALTCFLYDTTGGYPASFDANGDSVSQTWVEVGTVAETDAAIDSLLSKVGADPVDSVYPVWCSSPPAVGQSWKGYSAAHTACVKWNFTNA